MPGAAAAVVGVDTAMASDGRRVPSIIGVGLKHGTARLVMS